MGRSTVDKPRLCPDPWRVLTDALDDGIAYGLMRADKYTEHPDEQLTPEQRARVKRAVYDAVLNELSERFLWNMESSE